ncbi:hypothetical protein BS78_03G316300 [Paspalum vaginatum]|nr:hypothetical protein BS78_03G316300 [Paspalum vaginatum]
MAKVHPNSNVLPSPAGEEAEAPTTLTVWRKSLLFNCRGFTVFDARGDLAYRVDSYDAEAEVVLMDPAGRAAFTVRRKRLSLSGEQWLIYPGEESRRPVHAVKRGGGGGAKTMARVAPCAAASASAAYEVEGSYARRRCVVYDRERRAVAELQPKEAVVGTDVFRLVVRPGVDVSLAMAVVVALDQMFARPSLLRSWSS